MLKFERYSYNKVYILVCMSNVQSGGKWYGKNWTINASHRNEIMLTLLLDMSGKGIKWKMMSKSLIFLYAASQATDSGTKTTYTPICWAAFVVLLLKSTCTYNIQELLVPHVRCVPSISNSLICIGTHWAHVCHVHSCGAFELPFASNPLYDWRLKLFNYIPMRFPKCRMFHTQLQRNERKPKVISIHNHFKNCSHLFELNEMLRKENK